MPRASLDEESQTHFLRELIRSMPHVLYDTFAAAIGHVDGLPATWDEAFWAIRRALALGD